MLTPRDGVSLKPLFTGETGARSHPIPFRHQGRAALVDNRYKLLTENLEKGVYRLYDLEADPRETRDISQEKPEIANRLRGALDTWNATVNASQTGRDYPEGKVHDTEPTSRSWTEVTAYLPYFEAWKKRPEYASVLKSGKKASE
ncbi:MAG: hypothetical protein R3F31_00685 [Verrucomicrobiales bacterium]